MQFTGSFTVPAPRQRVWEGLNNPDLLRQCIPGCEELTRVSDTEFEGKVVAKIGHHGHQGGMFHFVHVAFMDSKGNLYTGEVANGRRVQKFSPSN